MRNDYERDIGQEEDEKTQAPASFGQQYSHIEKLATKLSAHPTFARIQNLRRIVAEVNDRLVDLELLCNQSCIKQDFDVQAGQVTDSSSKVNASYDFLSHRVFVELFAINKAKNQVEKTISQIDDRLGNKGFFGTYDSILAEVATELENPEFFQIETPNEFRLADLSYFEKSVLRALNRVEESINEYVAKRSDAMKLLQEQLQGLESIVAQKPYLQAGVISLKDKMCSESRIDPIGYQGQTSKESRMKLFSALEDFPDPAAIEAKLSHMEDIVPALRPYYFKSAYVERLKSLKWEFLCLRQLLNADDPDFISLHAAFKNLENKLLNICTPSPSEAWSSKKISAIGMLAAQPEVENEVSRNDNEVSFNDAVKLLEGRLDMEAARMDAVQSYSRWGLVDRLVKEGVIKDEAQYAELLAHATVNETALHNAFAHLHQGKKVVPVFDAGLMTFDELCAVLMQDGIYFDTNSDSEINTILHGRSILWQLADIRKVNFKEIPDLQNFLAASTNTQLPVLQELYKKAPRFVPSGPRVLFVLDEPENDFGMEADPVADMIGFRTQLDEELRKIFEKPADFDGLAPAAYSKFLKENYTRATLSKFGSDGLHSRTYPNYVSKWGKALKLNIDAEWGPSYCFDASSSPVVKVNPVLIG